MESSRADKIRHLLQTLQPTLLEIADDSHLHAGHNEAAKAGGTHLRLRIASLQFEGKSRVQCHRMVQSLLAEEFANGLHALQIEVVTLAP
jgi:BolA protein